MVWIQHLILITILLIFAQALFFRRTGLHSVSCIRKFSDLYAFENDEVYLLEEISNAKPIPVPLLVIESRINKNIELSSAVDLDANDSNYHKSIFSMLPFSKITRRHKVKLAKRGYYDLKSITVSTYDLLGFSTVMEDSVPVEAAITVYPRFLDQNDMVLPSHSFIGDIIARRWIIDDPFLRSGVRTYQQTDPLKLINWKATAKSGALQVNKHDYSASTKLLILLNICLEDKQWDEPKDTAILEYSISLSATFARYAIENSIDVGFMSNGSSVLSKGQISETPPGSGDTQLFAILESLALLSFKPVYSFHYLLNQLFNSGVSNTDILIITPYMSNEINAQVELLKHASNSVECVLPYGGDINHEN